MIEQEKAATLLRCLSEPSRLRILRLLADGEKSVGEIVEALDRDQPLVSHHLASLKRCRLVACRQDAQKVYYRLADPRLTGIIASIEAVAKDAMNDFNHSTCEGTGDKKCCGSS